MKLKNKIRITGVFLIAVTTLSIMTLLAGTLTQACAYRGSSIMISQAPPRLAPLQMETDNYVLREADNYVMRIPIESVLRETDAHVLRETEANFLRFDLRFEIWRGPRLMAWGRGARFTYYSPI